MIPVYKGASASDAFFTPEGGAQHVRAVPLGGSSILVIRWSGTGDAEWTVWNAATGELLSSSSVSWTPSSSILTDPHPILARGLLASLSGTSIRAVRLDGEGIASSSTYTIPVNVSTFEMNRSVTWTSIGSDVYIGITGDTGSFGSFFGSCVLVKLTPTGVESVTSVIANRRAVHAYLDGGVPHMLVISESGQLEAVSASGTTSVRTLTPPTYAGYGYDSGVGNRSAPIEVQYAILRGGQNLLTYVDPFSDKGPATAELRRWSAASGDEVIGYSPGGHESNGDAPTNWLQRRRLYGSIGGQPGFSYLISGSVANTINGGRAGIYVRAMDSQGVHHDADLLAVMPGSIGSYATTSHYSSPSFAVNVDTGLAGIAGTLRIQRGVTTYYQPYLYLLRLPGISPNLDGDLRGTRQRFT